jgi:uncharacterized membrane protein YdfJ with MMPL/SSD domain
MRALEHLFGSRAYRSPIFWVIPLFSVLMEQAFSRFCGWSIAEAGVTVNGQSAGVLPVLVFGAGTDYALLFVARYREELRRYERPVDAMRQALRRAGPAVFASGSTVILALLCLSLAQVNGTSGLGPIGAMGVALAMLSMLTLLPAALVAGGRRAFWPFMPRVDYNIFLMAPAREEALRHGTRHGMLRGLAVTGGVITSARIVLAGTFTMLATLPLKTLTELGFTIAFGVLLDTFIVRSALVPALVLDIGPRIWWPSALARKEETRYRKGEADSVPRTGERHPERPAALAASDTPDGPH